MKQKIFLIILIAVLLIGGRSMMSNFMINHQYYGSMFATASNRWLVFWGIVSVAMPVGYILYSKSLSLKNTLITTTLGLIVYSMAFVILKDSMVQSAGFIIFIINILLIFGLGLYSIVSWAAIGSRIMEKFIKIPVTRWQDLLLSFGLGLGAMMLVVHFLVVANIFYPILTWGLFILGGRAIWKQKNTGLIQYKKLIQDTLGGLHISNLRDNKWLWIGVVLLGLSMLYFYYGFQLSFIPYSTARDANHAYMYRPKVWAENNGALGRGNPGGAGGFLWLSYIAYFFSLIQPIKSWFWLSPDNIAVSMNFLSGLFVLVFGLGLVKEFVEYIVNNLNIQIPNSSKNIQPTETLKRIRKCLECGHMGTPGIKSSFDIRIAILLFLLGVIPFFIYYFRSKSNKKEFCQKCGSSHLAVKNSQRIIIDKGDIQNTERQRIISIGFYTGWAGLLVRMTSGMGAFLLFVDNKTDMGVLAMTVLALLSGIVFLRYIHDHKKGDNQETINRYIGLSGLFFGLAVAAKPTAFIDVVVFALLVVALWINSGLAIGLGIIVIAVLAKMQVLFTYEFISADAFIPLLLIGAIISIVSLGRAKKYITGISKMLLYTVRTFALWGSVLVISLLVIKGPYLVVQSIQSGEFSIGGFARGLLMGQLEREPLLLANTEDLTAMETQNTIDNTVVLPPAICSLDALGLSPEDLDKDLKHFEGGNGLSEDVGRYVGFGWKEFSQGLGYRVARIFFSQPNKCYGWNTSAKVLCSYEDAINNFDMSVLPNALEQMPTNSEGYTLLSDALTSEKLGEMLDTNSFNPAQMRDEIVQIRQWYQGRSIKAKEDSLLMPYRYVVPRNAVFNRSLQNLSSYYTDIGFVRGIVILLQIVALIYGLVTWNHRLIVLSAVIFVGRSIWWLIAGGIVWYGIGLIVWSILHLCVFLITLASKNRDDNEKMLFTVVIGILILWSAIQVLMNFVRISSQGGGGPFVWYKMSAGTQNVIENTLTQKQELSIPYTSKQVFDLQFAHYNKFIEYVKDRPDDHGVSIAGTYLQYFLHNQRNVGGANIYRTTSDGNTCKSYLRFQRDNWKYIVIDPNILSVVMGEGNESLMHRFFAKRNPVTGRIDEDGEMTMLVKMWYDDYLNLFSTNNLGAKYAFLLSDEELGKAFGLTTRDDLVFLRAKMGVARFFPDAQQIIGFIGNTFVQRIGNGQAVGDVADVFGKIIDEKKVLAAVQQVAGNTDPTKATAIVDTLTQDERFVLAQYLGLYNLLRQNSPQFQEAVNQILGQSVSGSSQVIIFELK